MITVLPTSNGLMMFCVYSVLNGRRQSRRPSAADTPTTLSCVSVMICRTPSTSAASGDAYDGPSPVHDHFTSPVLASNAVSAPLSLPPTLTITSPRSTSGEADVPYNGSTDVPGFCHSCLPLAASNAVTIPPIPSV